MSKPSNLLALAALAFLLCTSADRAPVDWAFWGGDSGGAHYSALADINASNVSGLRQAWLWKTGETPLSQYGTRPGIFENTPLMIDNVLYVSTPYNRVVALDPETGAELWSYDPKSYVDGQPPNGTGYVHRGIAAWRDARDGGKMRIFLNTPLSPDFPRCEDRHSPSIPSATTAWWISARAWSGRSTKCTTPKRRRRSFIRTW